MSTTTPLPPQTTGSLATREVRVANIITEDFKVLFMAVMGYYCAWSKSRMDPATLKALQDLLALFHDPTTLRWSTLRAHIEVIGASPASSDDAVIAALARARKALFEIDKEEER